MLLLSIVDPKDVPMENSDECLQNISGKMATAK